MDQRVISVIILFAVLSITSTVCAEKDLGACNNFFQAGDYVRAIDAGSKAVKKSPNNWEAHFCLGTAYKKTGDMKKSYSEIKKAEKLATDKKDLQAIYSYLGSLLIAISNDTEGALQYFNRSLKISHDMNNENGVSRELNNIASVYQGMGNKNKAIEYYEESLKHGPEEDKSSTYANLGPLIQGDDEASINKGLDYIRKAIDIDTKYGQYHAQAIHTLTLGNNYRYYGGLDIAETTLKDGLAKISKVGDKYWIAVANMYLGRLYKNKKDNKTAKEYYSVAYDAFKSIGETTNIKEVEDNIAKLKLVQE